MRAGCLSLTTLHSCLYHIAHVFVSHCTVFLSTLDTWNVFLRHEIIARVQSATQRGTHCCTWVMCYEGHRTVGSQLQHVPFSKAQNLYIYIAGGRIRFWQGTRCKCNCHYTYHNHRQWGKFTTLRQFNIRVSYAWVMDFANNGTPTTMSVT